MILSNNDIIDRLKSHKLRIEPMTIVVNADGDYEIAEVHELDPTQIQPASVDLTLGEHFRTLGHPLNRVTTIGDGLPTYHKETDVDEQGREVVFLKPGECVLGHTREFVAIPLDVSASVSGRSSIGRRFIEVHQTAGYIDPGFEGQITLEIVNNNPFPVCLPVGIRCAQLVLSLTASESGGYEGNYVGQVGPRESAL